MSKDVILTPEQIAAEERRWLFDAPIAELAEVKGVTVDEAVKLRTDAILQEAAVPIEVTVRPIEPQGKLIGFASVNYGGVVIDDFKVVDGKNGIFLGAPSKPDPTSRTGYRSTVGSMTGPPRSGSMRREPRRTIQRWKSSSPGPRQSAPPRSRSRWHRPQGRPGRKMPPEPLRQRRRRPGMTGDVTSRQIVPKSPACPEGLFLMDGIEGLRSLPKHSVDMLLTDPPYGTTRNFWDVPLPLPELWEAVKWAVKPDGAVLFFAQCPYDKVLGASNLSMLRYEWVWYKSRCTGFLNARRAPLKRTENILVFYQKLPYYDPQFEQGKPYKKISRTGDNSPNYGKFLRSSSGSEDGLRFPGNLLSFSSVQRTVHPTQKPVELCEYLIKTYTRPGEVVADICAGSGTTAVAALNMGRRFVCFETAPAFYAPATEHIRLADEAVKAGQKGV